MQGVKATWKQPGAKVVLPLATYDELVVLVREWQAATVAMDGVSDLKTQDAWKRLERADRALLRANVGVAADDGG